TVDSIVFHSSFQTYWPPPGQMRRVCQRRSWTLTGSSFGNSRFHSFKIGMLLQERNCRLRSESDEGPRMFELALLWISNIWRSTCRQRLEPSQGCAELLAALPLAAGFFSAASRASRRSSACFSTSSLSVIVRLSPEGA